MKVTGNLTFGYLFILFLFYFTILYWFCHTSTWIHHGCTRVPNPDPPSHFPPHTIPLGHPSPPAPSFLYPALNLNWRFISYMILCMFQCHSPKLSSPPHRVQKTVLFQLLIVLLVFLFWNGLQDKAIINYETVIMNQVFKIKKK